jgi:transposase
MFGCASMTVWMRCKKYGIKIRGIKRVKGLKKSLLQKLYVKEKKSTYTIAKILGCSHSTIRDYCKKYGIKLRPSQTGKLKGLNKATVKKLYLNEQKSINKIAKMLDCSPSSILYQCKRYGIKLRPRMKVIKGLNKSTLQRLYVKEDKSINMIAVKFKCSYSVIEYRCRKYGIQLRGRRIIKGLNNSVLQKLYVEEGKTVREIAKIIGCSREPIRLKCKQFGVLLRPPGNKRVDIDKSTLRRLYVKEGKSMSEIAKIYGCVVSTIYNKAKKIGL